MPAFGGLNLEQSGLTQAGLLPMGLIVGADGKLYHRTGELYNPDPNNGQPMRSPQSFNDGSTNQPQQAYQQYQQAVMQNQQQQMQQLQAQQAAQQQAPAAQAPPPPPSGPFDPNSLARYTTQVPMSVLTGGAQPQQAPSYAAHPFAMPGGGNAFQGLNTAAPAQAAPAQQPEAMRRGGPPRIHNAPWHNVQNFNQNLMSHHDLGGFIPGDTGGRTDNKNIGVKGDSYVIPADVVSFMGEGNSAAGGNILNAMFNQGPHDIKTKLPPNVSPMAQQPYARGGKTPHGMTPIVAASGEFIVGPDKLADKFGDPKIGHKVLDAFVKAQRQKMIKKTKALPAPKKGSR